MITLNTVWIFIIIGCIAELVGGILHSACTTHIKRIYKWTFDFVPLAYTLYVIGGVLLLIAMLCVLCLAAL